MSTAGMATEDENLPACPPGHLPAEFALAAERIHRAFLDALAPALSETLQTPVSAGTLSVVWVIKSIQMMPESAPGNAVIMISGSSHD